jgi:hypothetical protein
MPSELAWTLLYFLSVAHYFIPKTLESWRVLCFLCRQCRKSRGSYLALMVGLAEKSWGYGLRAVSRLCQTLFSWRWRAKWTQ